MGVTMEKPVPPHALLFPFPAQGHINPFMQLAHFLLQNNVMVTFLNTDINHTLISQIHSTQQIRFLSFPDGLPKDHGRIHNLPEFAQSLISNGPPHIEKIIQDDAISPISVIISDGMFSFSQNIADKFHIPRIAFWTTSACGFAAYNALTLLKEEAIIPAPEDNCRYEEWKTKLVGCIPAMETLRAQDLPSFFRTTDMSDYMLGWFEREITNTHRADLVVLNTWEDLEGPVLEQLNIDYNGKVLSVGPLTSVVDNMPLQTSLWREESSCLSWLDKQSPKSVIYVAFGSIALLSGEQFEEFASGLENCGQPFLWVIRPDLMKGKFSLLIKGFAERCQDRACFVNWAPQRKVLGHPSVAGFLSHGGWNSTMESICSGVPMLCWPYFAEQQTNTRFVSSVWNVGLDVSENIRREEIVEDVKKIMECYVEENDCSRRSMVMNALKYRESALLSTFEGGNSRTNIMQLLDKVLLDKIRGTSSQKVQ